MRTNQNGTPVAVSLSTGKLWSNCFMLFENNSSKRNLKQTDRQFEWGYCSSYKKQ